MGRSVPAYVHAPGRGGLTWKSCRNTVLWLAILLLLPVCGADAQISNAGRITGTVVDPSGAGIPGAEVTATDPANSFTQTVKATATGLYVFSDLQAGTYEIEATANGFSKAVYQRVVVSVAQTTNLRIKMKVGATSQTVSVSAAAQVLQTTQTTLSTTISPTMMENLPLNGRDVLEFAALAPGDANPGIHGNNYNTYNDLPNAALNITVGGTADQFQRYKTFSSSFWAVAPVREGAFQEATVSTAGLGSASGGAASQLQFAVKSGTNKFHGRVFWQAENSFFNANSWYYNARGIPLPKTRDNWFGGNLGGPLLPERLVGKHHVYFFVNLEYNRVPNSFTLSNNTLTPDAANGRFTYEVSGAPSSYGPGTAYPWITTCGKPAGTCTANLYALASANGFSASENSSVGKILGGISSYYKNGKLEALAPTAAGLQADNAYYLQELLYSINRTRKVWYPTTRLDVDITSKIHWSDSWDLEDSKSPSYANWPGSPYVGNYTGFNNTYYTWTNNVRWMISPTMINTASFGILGTEEVYTPGAQPSGFKLSPVDGVPSQIETPFSIPTLVPSVAEEVPRDNPVFNPSDTLRWTHGNHSFYLGGNLIYSKMREQQWVFPGVPDYTTGIAPGDPAASMFALSNFPNINNATSSYSGETAQQAAESLYAFLTGRVSSVGGGTEVNPATGKFQPGYGYTAREAKTEGSIYFQDSWQATNHFTLNYGLRWQLSGAIHNTNGEYFSATYHNLLGPSGSLFQPGKLNGIQNPYMAVNEQPYHGDFVQPAPNLGFAWNPDFTSGFLGKLFGGHNTVIRASYSIDPYDEGWETFENNTVYNGAGYAQYLYYASSAGMFAPGSLSLTSPGLYNSVEATATPPSYQSALPESTYAFFSYPYIGGIDPNLKQPYVEQWYFGIQRQLPGHFVVQVDYVGNHGVHEWQSFNLNEVNTLNNGFAAQFKTAMSNYSINSAHGMNSFADNTGYSGVVATPIFDAAFNGNGISTGASDAGGYANPGYIYDLSTGQAGALGTSLARNFSTFCNMAGANFGPCGHSGGTYPINFFQANPYGAVGGAYLLSDPAGSNYNGLQISVRHPVGHGLSLGGSYTYSKGLTSRFLGGWTDTAALNFTSLRNPGLNKGPSDYDIRDVFHTYFTYNLPVGRGRHFDVGNSFLNAVVGGWNVGSIITWQSGIPFWVKGGYDSFNNQDGGVVVKGVNASQIQNNIGVYLTPSSPYAPVWINPKFKAPSKILPNTTPGTIGQLLFLHGPGLFNTDLSLNKVFPIHENLSLKVQASFLNAFNHPNWAVGTSFNDTNAPGGIVYANSTLYQPLTHYQGSPRVIEFRTEIDF